MASLRKQVATTAPTASKYSTDSTYSTTTLQASFSHNDRAFQPLLLSASLWSETITIYDTEPKCSTSNMWLIDHGPLSVNGSVAKTHIKVHEHTIVQAGHCEHLLLLQYSTTINSSREYDLS